MKTSNKGTNFTFFANWEWEKSVKTKSRFQKTFETVFWLLLMRNVYFIQWDFLFHVFSWWFFTLHARWLNQNQTKFKCWTAFKAAFCRFFSIFAKKSSSVLIACISSSLLKILNFILKKFFEIQTLVYWEIHRPIKRVDQNRKMISSFVQYIRKEYR